MQREPDLIGLFARNLATHLVGKADGMETQALACADSDPLGATWYLGASDAYRVLADALDGSGRSSASTARHTARVEHDRPDSTLDDWDCTPADLYDNYNEREER